MSVNQDLVPYDDDVSRSFWDIGGYKPTLKRVADGYQLCNELTSLIRERSEIENKYAASLRSWNKKWADHIGKGEHLLAVYVLYLGTLCCCVTASLE